MERYIQKSAVVEEIKRRAAFFLEQSKKKTTLNDSSCATALYGLLFFLDTLEVKEVDLETEVDTILETNDWNYDKIDFYAFAKHFFELGLKAQKGE